MAAPRKGSFEDLIFGRRRSLGKRELEAFQDSFPKVDRTAEQFGVKAVSSVEEAEEGRFPWLRSMRRGRAGRRML